MAAKVVSGNDHECPVLYELVDQFVNIIREKKRQEKLQNIKQEKSAIAPEKILVRRQAAVINQFRSWSSCTVPLSVVANKELYADGHADLVVD